MTSAATKLLANQFRGILNDPVEGFTVELEDESSLYEWKVFIEGPRDTPYEGGIFQLQLSFPKDYPMNPPVLKFRSDFWHPNVYHDGKVCMSILHPPGEDAMSGELAQERWLPTQSVTTIVLSLLSLLNDPNCSSPANVDASVEWRKSRDSYVQKCKKLVEKANREKPPHVVIPHPDTNEEEHKRVVQKWKEMNTEMDYNEFYDHDDAANPDVESDDEHENEFLESNEEINSESSDKEDEEPAASASDKGKSPESEGASKKIVNEPPTDVEISHAEASNTPSALVLEVSVPDAPPAESEKSDKFEKIEKVEKAVASSSGSNNAASSSSNNRNNDIIIDENGNAPPENPLPGKKQKRKSRSGTKKPKCIVM